MGTGIYFPVAGLFFSILLVSVYFSKRKIKTFETDIYGILIITNFVGLILEILCTYAAMIYNDNRLIADLILKFYLEYITTFSFFYTIYIISLSKTKNIVTKHKKGFIMLLTVLYIISVVLTLILPIELVVENNFSVRYTQGPSVSFTYAISGVMIGIWIISLLLNLRKNSIRKYLPLLLFVLGGGTAVIIQLCNPGLLLITYVETLVTFMMYFSIENPDVKLLYEVEMAKDKAEKANAAKTDFLSSMSHEIRTPLNAIVGFSQAIQEEDTLEEAKQDAKDIVLASQNLLELVNGILDISKIEANKMEIVNSEYNFKEECDNLVKLIKPRIADRPIQFNYNMASDIPKRLYGDKGKMKEVISNLLTNAAKYTDKGKIDFNISCINKGEECSLIVSVEDTGRGIKPDQIDKLFNKFERLDEDRNTTIEGSGLGLAITKSLVEMMGGKIVVQSVYGSGSKFTLYIKQKIGKTNLEVTQKMTFEELVLVNKKVLVVDDNLLNIKVAERLLKNYGIIVETCESGYDCIDRVKQGLRYDLILMDDMMPKMTGTETLHLLQQMPEFKDKIVVLTANAIEGMKDKYLDAGFDDYLAKPIEKPELERVLRKFLNKQIERTKFEPLPDEMFEISDEDLKKVNETEIET